MSSLELLAAVTAIIVAYNKSAISFQLWLHETRERYENPQNQQLDQSLIAGGSEIQYEYDDSVSRIGARFSSGDATAHTQLSHCLHQLQAVTSILAAESGSSNSSSRNHTTIPSLSYITSISESTRTTTISILREQYQRLLYAGPLPQSFVSPHHRSQIRGSIAAESQRDLVRRGPSVDYSDNFYFQGGSYGQGGCYTGSTETSSQSSRHHSRGSGHRRSHC